MDDLTVSQSVLDSPPVVTSFSVPASSTSLSIPITTFTATDDQSVAGYLITETATVPAVSDPAWSATPPSTYLLSTQGAKTLFAWAKDLSGNISAAVSASVMVSISTGEAFGAPVRLTTNSAMDIQPGWAPDGTTVFFVSNRLGGIDGADLFSVNADGTGERQVANYTITDTYHGRFGVPAWISGTGDIMLKEYKSFHEHLRFNYSAALSANALPVGRNAANGDSSYITRILYVPGGQGSSASSVSPDGTAMAWNHYGSGASQLRYYKGSFTNFVGNTDTAGQQLWLLSSGILGQPTFSPDGNKIALSASPTGAAIQNVYIVDIQTKVPTKITDFTAATSNIESVSWSSKNQIVFSVKSVADDKMKLYSVNPDGSNLKLITSGTENYTYPAWSPDGTKLAYSSDANGNYDIYVMPLISDSFPLAVNKIGNGTVTTNSTALTWNGNIGSANYASGSYVTLTATADAGSQFAGWSGACSGTSNCVLTISAAKNVTATFVADTTPPASQASPAGGDYVTAQTVTLSTTKSATLYFTTDGTDPVSSSTSTTYSTPILLSASSTLRFYAVDAWGNTETPKQEIYSINALPIAANTTSQATRLTFNSATDIQPAWSPDGKRIAFVSNRIAPSDGSDLYSIEPNGQNETLLAKFTFTDYWHGRFGNPAWIGNTGDLLLMDYKFFFEGMRLQLASAESDSAIPVTRSVQDGDSSYLKRLLFVPGGEGMSAMAISADTTKMAWAHNHNPGFSLRMYSGDKSNLIGNSDTAGTALWTLPAGAEIYSPVFSPDGSKLVVAACETNCQTNSRDLYIVNTATSAVTKITNLTTMDLKAMNASWSSSNIIAFSAISQSDNKTKLFIINPDGSGFKQLSDGTSNDDYPTWSPDGTRLAFASDVSGNYEIYSLRLVGSENQLTITKSGNGTGNITANTGSLVWNGNTGTGMYASGTPVILTATPDGGSQFSGWSGACAGTGSCSLSMDSLMYVTANFTKQISAPSNVEVNLTATQGTLKVTWTNPVDSSFSHIHVYRSFVSGEVGTLFADNIDGTSYTDTNLGYQVTYWYTLRSVDSSGNESTNSNQVSGTIPEPTPPSATTGAASSIISAGATLNGTVSSNGAATTVTFDYGTSASYGSTAAASQSPLAAGASGSTVTADISGLTCNTTYHFRVKGQNSTGTTNGSDATFTTSACAPTSTTVISSANPSTYGHSVTFTASVTSSSETLTGAVTFMDGTLMLGTGTLTGSTATLSTTTLALNDHSITAVYSGNSNFAGSTSVTLIQTIVLPASIPIVTSSLSLTNNNMPTWSWNSGGGGGVGTYRYKLDSSDLSSGATTATSTIFSPSSPLADGAHTLYVQERDAAGNWSSSGSFIVIVDTTGPVEGKTITSLLDISNWDITQGTAGMNNNMLTVGPSLSVIRSKQSFSQPFTFTWKGYFPSTISSSHQAGFGPAPFNGIGLPTTSSVFYTVWDKSGLYTNGSQVSSAVNSNNSYYGEYSLSWQSDVVAWFFNGVKVNEIPLVSLDPMSLHFQATDGQYKIESASVTTGTDNGIAINYGANTTKTASVILTLSATDLNGVSTMMISNNAGFTESTEEAYATSKAWILTSGDGNKTVYIKFKDVAGNWSQIYSASITLYVPPTATTGAASSITATSATLNGTVSSNGASTTVTFGYGTSASYGKSVTASQSPLSSGASGSAVTAALTGLTCNTTYHYRVVGQNSAGTTNGSDATFTTSACPQTITFGALTTVSLANSPLTLTATATSGLAVSFSSSDTSIATVSGNTLTLLKSGTVYITASQAGNAAWLPAPNVIRVLTVIAFSKPNLTVSTLAGGSVTKAGILNISGTATSTDGSVTVTINGAPVTLASDNSFSAAYQLTPGSNNITTVATDSNSQITSDSRTITLNLTAPELGITAPVDNSSVAGSLLTVTGSVTDANATVKVALNNGTAQNASRNGLNFSSDLNLREGQNTIQVTATDLTPASSSLARTVTWNRQGPTLAITSPAADISTDQANITLTGAIADALSDVTVTITCDGHTYTHNVTAPGGSFSQALTFATAGTYPVTVTAVDTNSNHSTSHRTIIYHPQPVITITSNPVGRSVVVDGVTVVTPQNYTWSAGSSHTIAVVTPTQTGSSGTRYQFGSWSDAGAASHSISVPATSATYTAGFATQYQITTGVSPAGTGTVSPATGSWYAAGTVVPVKAFPNTGYGFISWTGPVAGSASATTSVTMTGPVSITAGLGSNPVLTPMITAKSGTTPRTWSINLGNSGQTTASSARIIGLALTLTAGTACTPVINPAQFPVVLGDIAAGGSATGGVTIDFTGCAATNRYTATISYSFNGGAVSGAKSYANQFK